MYGGSGITSVEVDTISIVGKTFEHFVQYFQAMFTPDDYPRVGDAPFLNHNCPSWKNSDRRYIQMPLREPSFGFLEEEVPEHQKDVQFVVVNCIFAFLRSLGLMLHFTSDVGNPLQAFPPIPIAETHHKRDIRFGPIFMLAMGLGRNNNGGIVITGNGDRACPEPMFCFPTTLEDQPQHPSYLLLTRSLDDWLRNRCIPSF